MSDERDAYRVCVSYIDRTREFYEAQGYEKPYRWARFDDVPFARLKQPLASSRVTLVTTASEWWDQQPQDGVLRGAKQVWSDATALPPKRLFTDDLSWDKQATHTDDVESFLPIRQLDAFAAEGRIGSVAKRFHSVPTEYSQRRTLEEDAPEILRRCREDAVDAVLLAPL